MRFSGENVPNTKVVARAADYGVCVLELFTAQHTGRRTLRRVRMNYDEQLAHKLGRKDGADFAASAKFEQLANIRRVFNGNAETILLRMHAKTRPTSTFTLSGYFALAILGDNAGRGRVEEFWRPYFTGETETDAIYDEPYYLLGFVDGALAARTASRAHQEPVGLRTSTQSSLP
jgi:hypothetical protein